MKKKNNSNEHPMIRKIVDLSYENEEYLGELDTFRIDYCNYVNIWKSEKYNEDITSISHGTYLYFEDIMCDHGHVMIDGLGRIDNRYYHDNLNDCLNELYEKLKLEIKIQKIRIDKEYDDYGHNHDHEEHNVDDKGEVDDTVVKEQLELQLKYHIKHEEYEKAEDLKKEIKKIDRRIKKSLKKDTENVTTKKKTTKKSSSKKKK
ncbi:hypothetical protein COB55_03570 [Candidatus Wolfebacteria bacterium]|nr:MAG: hypothetical protein COB55_03570 [Candidatus Wolfebacteria bacterium]